LYYVIGAIIVDISGRSDIGYTVRQFYEILHASICLLYEVQ